MRLKPAVFAALFAVLLQPAQAQIGVQLDLPRREFVLYEPIMADVSLLNSSGKNIIFEQDKNWLEFLITREKVELIPSSGSSILDKNIYLDSASTASMRVNLTYTHEIRDPGTYEIQARVRYMGRTFASAPVQIAVSKGAVQWKQRFVYVNPKTKKEETRDYELVAQRADHGNRLLARIRDPEKRQVMCCTPIGDLMSYGEPSAKVDGGGTLHVLNQTSPRQFLYSKISPEGIREKPRMFLALGSKPSLIEAAETGVMVIGGTELGEDGKMLLSEPMRRGAPSAGKEEGKPKPAEADEEEESDD